MREGRAGVAGRGRVCERDCWQVLRRRGGSQRGNVYKGSIAVAVNQQYALAGVVLKDGDEVALLPPVSGGVR